MSRRRRAGAAAVRERRWGGAARLAVACVLVASAVASCQRAPALLPPKPATLDVTMREFRFDSRPPPSGRVVFRVSNVGRINHRLALAPLPADFPPIQQQLHGEDRQLVDTLVSIPDVPPGGTDSFAADIAPGRWAFLCFVIAPDGESHAFKGMATEFRVP